LQRTSEEPPFSTAERAHLTSLLPTLSLMADLWLSSENLTCENAVLRALGADNKGLVLIVDPNAGHVLWARDPGQNLDWERDVLPLGYAALEQVRKHPNLRSAVQMAPEPDVDLPLSIAPVQITEFAKSPCLAIAVSAAQRPNSMEPLSQRERQVAELLVEGYANVNIAAHLQLSENTVRTYVRRLYRKLGVYNRLQLVRATSPTRPAEGL
jgi:DNA-binding CsgD family transcriptional regulator